MSLDWIEPNFSGPSLYLPPAEVVTYDVRKEGRIDTPIHEDTKLVDRKALMFIIKGTVVPEYDWKSPVENTHTSDHHLHWPHPWYENKSFRNHGSRRTKIMPVPHRWIHEITVPPNPASKDVEYLYLEGRELADGMRNAAGYPLFLGRETLRINKEVHDFISSEHLEQLKKDIQVDVQIDLDQQLENFGRMFDQAKTGPKEFQVIDYSKFELRSVSDMMKISRAIVKKVKEEAEMDQRILNGEIDLISQ